MAGVNQVFLGAVKIMDISDSTVTPETLGEGATAYDKTGEKITGTMTASEDLDAELTAQDTLIERIQTALQGKAAGGSGEDESYKTLYQRVENITSDGTSYVITDFVGDNTCGLELIASFPVLQDRVPMGSRIDSGSTRFYCTYPLSANSCYYGFNTGASFSCGLSVNTPYRLQTNFMDSRLVNVYDMDGNREGGTNINATLTPHTVPVSIFGYHYASSGAVTSKREFTLYSARCSRGNEIVREYIPCYRKSDGVIGLYEKFTGTFLTAEAGAFTKGADIDW